MNLKKILLTTFSILLSVSIVTLHYGKASAADVYTNDLIPTMTSNSTPSGRASASSEYSTTYQAYRAFNDAASESYGWVANGFSSPQWLEYDFDTPKTISKYTLKAEYPNEIPGAYMPKTWDFQAFDDTTSTWVTLDSRSNQPDWPAGTKREFTFANTKAYSKYRLYITAITGPGSGVLVVGEVEMMSKVPSGRAIITITMVNGLEKEYDLSMDEVNSFIAWYDAKAAGTGPAKYAFTKTWNKGPFKARTEYVIFDKILTFNVDEYNPITP
ncbi:discoidin domain-containing protein [Cohnella sp. CFH 77786]|uniref:discoidin domain-containing protein n=1 Tax=Cohnella sp. CFH 77786 TaxID=2662265 RepID=UPI001C609A44|nr:discoidin domain-containing protein [Cohnella sp. CFH 77786]